MTTMQFKGLLPLTLKQLCDCPIEPFNENRFLTTSFGMLRSIGGVRDIHGTMVVNEQPYRILEGRILHIKSGCIRVKINLQEYVLRTHHLIIASPGTVFQLVDVSSDFDMSMIAFTNDFLDDWKEEELLKSYMRGHLYFCTSLEEEEERRWEELCSILWELLHDAPFPMAAIQSLISILFYHAALFRRDELAEMTQRKPRQEEIFDRFIDLVNIHAVGQRNVSFYANRLCLTPRYLSTIVRQASGRTVMDWINEAIVQEAKMQLRHTNKPVYQIADELNFPNPSFFCKYFRRLTGLTPRFFRKKV